MRLYIFGDIIRKKKKYIYIYIYIYQIKQRDITNRSFHLLANCTKELHNLYFTDSKICFLLLLFIILFL